MASNTETWRNQGNGSVWVWIADRFGHYKDQTVRAGGKIQITPDDRRYNQERAADDSLDIFSNGTLVPVRLIEGSEDAREIAANPNLISESDMVVLFSLEPGEFDKKLADITNPVVLQKLVAMSEDEEVDASLRQAKRIAARLTEVTDKAKREEPEDTTGARVGGERVGTKKSGKNAGDGSSSAVTP